MLRSSREPKSIVGRLYAQVQKSPDSLEAIAFSSLHALEEAAFDSYRPHELERAFYRFQEFFHPDDIPPTGAHLHDLLALKHAIMALLGMTQILLEARSHLSILPQIIDDIRSAWPAVWRYIEVIDRNFICSNDAPIEYHGLDAPLVVKTVVPALHQILGQEELVETMKESGVYALFVRLWYRLAFDGACDGWPFDVCVDVFTDLLPDEDTDLRDQVITPLGGESKVAKAALSHLRLSMRAMQQKRPGEGDMLHASRTAVDIAALAGTDFAMAYALLAQNAVRQMTRALVFLATLPKGHDVTLSIFMDYLVTNISVSDSITWVIQALDVGLLIAILRYEPWYASNGRDDLLGEDEKPEHIALLVEILPRYLVFLSVVRAARKALKKAKKSGAEKRISRRSDLWAGWVAFENLVKKRVDIAGKSSRQKNLCSRCGQKESGGRGFRQCSGCTDVYYCSSACQKRDWQAQHRTDCKNIQRNRLEGRIVNASPSDYAFVPTFIRQDFQDLGVIDLCRRDWGTNPPERPSLYLDYADHQAEPETGEYLADFDGPTRRDVVVVHVVLPNEEDTWFVLRSDEDEGSRTERLIGALSSQGPIVEQADPVAGGEGHWFGENCDLDDDPETDSDWTDVTDSDEGVDDLD